MEQDKDKCIYDLWKLLDEINEKVKLHDMSLFRTSGIGGCDMYQGMPPLARIYDSVFYKHEDEITQAIRKFEPR